jgi:transketolase
VLAQNIPWFLGGSADLGPSNKTTLKFAGAGDFEAGSPGGRNSISASASTPWPAIVNGMSLSKLRPSARPSSSSATTPGRRFRLSALMELPTILVFTTTPWATARMGRRISRSSS